MANMPKVVIVGRTNVGKSTLFNRLAENVRSLMLDQEGVTRDFLTDIICWQDRCFELIDSGGIALRKSEDPLAEKVRSIAWSVLEQADVVLFVCDGTVGPLEEDVQLAKAIHKMKKPTILVVNKADSGQTDEHLFSFKRLGFDYSIPISAQHGTGTSDLLDALLAVMPKQVSHKEEKPEYKVVLLGKPNVGKSSLMNLLIQTDRSLVTDIPGTTREALSAPRTFYQQTVMLTDTPGIRRKRTIDEPLEKMMVQTSFRALDNADVVLLLIDGSTGQISDQELKLAFYAFDQGKALILLINKEDLMDDFKREQLEEQLDYYKHFFKKIPRLYISCKSGKHIGRILSLVSEVWQRYNQTFPDDLLTQICVDALTRTPLYRQKEMLVLKRVRQLKTAPPILLLKVNRPQWIGESQRAFLENTLRSHIDLRGVPVLFIARKGR